MYCNINSNREIIMAEDKKYSKRELEIKTITELSKGISDLPYFNHISGSQYSLAVKLENDDIYNFIITLKNITGAGWQDKPRIKRVQVKNIKNEAPDLLYYQNATTVNLIMGYYNFDNNPLIVCWDAYRYLNHNTLRSCYVNVDCLLRGYEKKFYEGVVSQQKCWVFKGEQFAIFIKKYIEYNKKLRRM